MKQNIRMTLLGSAVVLGMLVFTACGGGTKSADIVYFVAGEPSTGYELWKSDGSTAGTVLVKDIDPGPIGSNPDKLTAAVSAP